MTVKQKIKPQTATIEKYLIEKLKAYGVKHIFGMPGDSVLQLTDNPCKNRPTFINTTRENTAGYMADAYARLNGIGAVCIGYGVGINIANAVSQAFVENSPLVIISGTKQQQLSISSSYLHLMYQTKTNDFEGTTQLDIFKKITQDQAVLNDQSIAKEQIDKVLHVCFSQKKPVYIEIPESTINSEIFIKPLNEPVKENLDAEALDEVIEECAHFLKNSNQPVIWLGHEIQRHNLGPCILNFAEKYRIPIVTSLIGKTAISEFHPLFMGIYEGKMSSDEVKDYVETADAVFSFGVLLNASEKESQTKHLISKQTITATTKSIQVNHHQYPNVSLKRLLERLSHLDLNIRFRHDYPAYIDSHLFPFKSKKNKKITVEKLFQCLQANLQREHLIVTDFGDALFGSSTLVLGKDNFVANPHFATLGFGIPAAIGTCFASPEKRTIAIVGDGAFQMTCTELSTALRYDLNPVIILLNNHGYATEKPLINGKNNSIYEWKYHNLPKLLGGGIGVLVKTEDQFEKAIKEAFEDKNTLTLIEVNIAKEDQTSVFKRFSEIYEI